MSGIGSLSRASADESCRRTSFVRLDSFFAASHRPAQFDWAWVPIIGLGLLDVLLARWFGMRFLGWQKFSLKIAFPAAVAVYYRVSARSDRLADIGYYMTTWLAFSVFGCILTYLAARVDLPVRDVEFAHFDALLGFDWYRWTIFIVSHKNLAVLLGIAYSTILPQTIGSVIYFSHIRRPDRNDDLLWTTMVAAIITTVMSALLPALGPRFRGQYVEWSATLAAIRDGSASTFSLENLQGIIAFPSFHTVAALLLVYSHRPPVPSFRAILVLNLLMLLSIPAAGQHYLVDMLSGAVVAAVSIAAVRIAMRPNTPAKMQTGISNTHPTTRGLPGFSDHTIPEESLHVLVV
jgi:PAP2 superfamily